MRALRVGLSCLAIGLSGCADPHFIHDPQQGFFSKAQLPPLLKSLRCELVTYIAANNQHHILNDYLFQTGKHVDANRDFPFFPIDPARYGGMSIELKVQDSLGTQSGTTGDWKRTDADKVHSRTWHIGPTLSEQNSYDMLTGFLLPQDIYGLDTSERPKRIRDELSTDSTQPYLCYGSIPERAKTVDPRLSNAVYTVQDLDAVASGKGGTAQFNRILVDGGAPLAAWLQDAARTVTSASLVQSDAEQNEAMVPGQQTYTFAIMTTASLDIKESITTSLWTAVGGEVSGGWQHTGTLTIVLNGADAANTSGVKSGSTTRVTNKQTFPEIRTSSEKNFCDLPLVNGRPADPTKCHWPPRDVAAALTGHRKGGAGERGKGYLLPKTAERPSPGNKLIFAPKQRTPAFRNFGEHGTVAYPGPLLPLGTH